MVEVVKVNTGTYHGNWLEFFNRLLCHAILFPATKYFTIGFTKVDETFAVLIQQQFALLTEGAPRSIVEPDLLALLQWFGSCALPNRHEEHLISCTASVIKEQ
jgi:hypothetical protein